jgi:transcriptional regulator with XRE-family HTH domain
MSDLNELTDELIQDPGFKKEYDSLQTERDIALAIISARKNVGMTQNELAKKSGISQADISRLETGNRNPSIALLQRLAQAMNTVLRIEFMPSQDKIR